MTKKHAPNCGIHIGQECDCDGFHTFEELYDARFLYNALAFNELTKKYQCVKSTRHSDGHDVFDGGWFIVQCQLPQGQISQHYPIKYWPYFKVPEQLTAWAWDGHTFADVKNRVMHYISTSPEEVEIDDKILDEIDNLVINQDITTQLEDIRKQVFLFENVVIKEHSPTQDNGRWILLEGNHKKMATITINALDPSQYFHYEELTTKYSVSGKIIAAEGLTSILTWLNSNKFGCPPSFLSVKGLSLFVRTK